MTAKGRNRLTQFLVVCGVIAGLLFIRTLDPGIMSTLRGAGFDTLQRLFPRQMLEPAPVRVVDIDEASLAKIGQWPWSRATLAQLTDALIELGSVSVAFDIVFPEPDRLSPRLMMQDPTLAAALPATFNSANLPDNDTLFAASLSGRPTVTAFAFGGKADNAEKLKVKSGFAEVGAPSATALPPMGSVIVNLQQLDAVAAGVGAITLDLAGEQGIARQIPLMWSDGARFAPSLSVEALRVAQGVDTVLINSAPDTENAIESIGVGEIDIPTSEDGRFYIHYRPDSPDLYVSAADLLDTAKREELRGKLEGHIVFVGTSATGLLDNRTNALGQNIPGVSIHAQAVEQMLTGRFLSRPDWVQALEYLGVLLGGLAIAAVGAFYRPLASFIVAISASAITAAISLLSFKLPGLLLDVTWPIIAFTLIYLASTAWQLAITDRDGRNMRKLFGHYVAPSVLADIENNPQSLKLGGEVRDVTVMFVDVANFTPLSEKLSPTELVNTINGLWDACAGAILREQGTIDKFIGDAIMAFWNAPVAIPNHQFHAAKAALGIINAVDRYNDSPAVSSLLAEKNLPPLAVRIGLASGPACVGNMGSADRFDYSVLGDTVNIAARTESVGKRAAHSILIAGAIHPETKKLALLQAGHSPMKGKSGVEPIHALIGDETERSSNSFNALRKEHDHLASKLSEKPSARNLASIRQLLDEVALHNPKCAPYLRAMADRPEDFIRPSPGP